MSRAIIPENIRTCKMIVLYRIGHYNGVSFLIMNSPFTMYKEVKSDLIQIQNKNFWFLSVFLIIKFLWRVDRNSKGKFQQGPENRCTSAPARHHRTSLSSGEPRLCLLQQGLDLCRVGGALPWYSISALGTVASMHYII